jgi:KDO2-lipid IV(A) lauroyltransferase
VALENLAAACPDWQEDRRRATARRSFEHLGRLLVEILTLGAPGAPPSVVEGWEHVEAAASAGKGYFLLSGHFGNWEKVAHRQAERGLPLWMVARPLDNPLLERYFSGLRQGTGNRVVYKRNAVREIVRGLKQGKGIAFVIDQNFGEPGRVFVPFFGRPAATTPTLGIVAVRMGVPVIPVFAFPEPDGSYRIVYEPPLRTPCTGDAEADALEVTARATARIEAAVGLRPEAWFWMHRRWRTRPPGESEERENP